MKNSQNEINEQQKPIFKEEIHPVLFQERWMYEPTGHFYKECEKYLRNLRTLSQAKRAKEEIQRFASITENQREYLREKLKYHRDKKEQCGFGSQLYVKERQMAIRVSNALKRDTILSRNPVLLDFGEKVLLELKIDEGPLERYEVELIPHSYFDENTVGFLSATTRLGFSIYKAAMGDTFHLAARGSKRYYPNLYIHVAQFGIDSQNLIIPGSANLLYSTEKEKRKTRESIRFLQQEKPMMTQSQKLLLDREIEKMEASLLESPSSYFNYLTTLQGWIKNGTIPIQTEEQVRELGEKIGVGSHIQYALFEKDKKIIKETEFIIHAYTTESKEKYTELTSPFGRNLIGKGAKDSFVYRSGNQWKKGIILSVQNENTKEKMESFQKRKK